MTSTSVRRHDEIATLQADYRAAFEAWAAQSERLRCQRACGGDGARAETQAEVDAAEDNYRSARDRLAAELMDDAA